MRHRNPMSRVARAFLIAALLTSGAIGILGYCIVMFASGVHTEFSGFITMLAGLGSFLVCMHAWTDLS